MVYCPVEKAACSTWKTIFANISSGGKIIRGMSPAHLRSLHAAIGRRFGLEILPYNASLSSNTKLLVVRHPLDRLLSAYRDKMRGGDITFRNGSFKVVQQFRTNISNNDPYPTFREFVTMLFTNTAIARNPHWDKYFFKCDPCNIEYDYILKVETMEHDMKMFMSEVLPDSLRFVSEPKLNSFGPVSGTIGSPQNHLLKAYEVFSAEELQNIYSKYQYEHEFYGYGFNQNTLQATCCDPTSDAIDNTSALNCCC